MDNLTRHHETGHPAPMVQPAPSTIRALRNRLGWTQEEAARECRVTLRTYSRWENDKSKMPEIAWRWMAERAGVPEEWSPEGEG